MEAANSDFDPFAELDSEVNNVEDMARETSGPDAISIRETASGFFDPPICHELPDNWEDFFFRQVGQDQAANDDNDEDNEANDEVVQQVSVSIPKLTTYREAIASLEDVLRFLESRGNSDTANDLSKVICQTQSDWLERKKSQSKVTDFFLKF